MFKLVCDRGSDVEWDGGTWGNGDHHLSSVFDRKFLDLAGGSSADHRKIQVHRLTGTTAEHGLCNSFFPTHSDHFGVSPTGPQAATSRTGEAYQKGLRPAHAVSAAISTIPGVDSIEIHWAGAVRPTRGHKELATGTVRPSPFVYRSKATVRHHREPNTKAERVPMRIVRAAIVSLALIADVLIAEPAGTVSADVPASNPKDTK